MSAGDGRVTWLLFVYPWTKAFHIISVIAWMAGLLYLPRLFVYHASEPVGSKASDTFKIMERRLLRGIMNPALGATLVFGVLLLLTPGVIEWSDGWLHVKLLAVAGLIVLHHMMARWCKDFAEDRNTRPARFYRIVNEAPTLLMIIIVIMVVVKPF
jgi:putative membrane protein